MTSALQSFVTTRTAKEALELNKALTKVPQITNATSTTSIMYKRGSKYAEDGKTLLNGTGYSALSSKPVDLKAPKCLGKSGCTVSGFNETKAKILDNFNTTSALKNTHPLSLQSNRVF
jgi:hypothetical protein